MPRGDEENHRDTGESFAELAEQYADTRREHVELTRQVAATHALLAIYYELRHNDLGAKFDKLTEQLTDIAVGQAQRVDIESGLVEGLKNEIIALKNAVDGLPDRFS